MTNMSYSGVPFPPSTIGAENIAVRRGDKRTRRNALMDGQSTPQIQLLYRSH